MELSCLVFLLYVVLYDFKAKRAINQRKKAQKVQNSVRFVDKVRLVT